MSQPIVVIRQKGVNLFQESTNIAVKLIKGKNVSPFIIDNQSIVPRCESVKLPTGKNSFRNVKLETNSKSSFLHVQKAPFF